MQTNEFLVKKLEQMKLILHELNSLLVLPFSEFKKQFTNIRTAERNFQLLVELASDINAYIITRSGGETPDTYRNSFKKMAELNVLGEEYLKPFIKSANLRNILVHEYDFDEDNFIFYNSAKELAPVYDEYIKMIYNYISK